MIPGQSGRPFVIALILSLLCLPVLADTVIHREKSLYRNIVVTERGDRRCLAFSVKRAHRNQTCINTEAPNEIVFPYVRMVFAGLLANPTPTRGLMIGLGGGTISNVLTEVYPDMQIDLVEVDQAVVRVARDYFDFRESDNTRVIVQDGRVFTRRAVMSESRYDFIILDAFTGDYIPEHLMTQEFLEDVRALLSPNGVVVANTFARSDLYDHESVTYRAVFGEFLNLKMPGTGNRVIVANDGTLPDRMTLGSRADQLAATFERYSVDLPKFVPYLMRKPDWNTRKRPLTDQFAPANLLRGR